MATREELPEHIFYKMKTIGNDEEYLYRPLEKQDIYDNLSAETKEQQKCEYCHEPYDIFKGGDRVGFWFNSHNQLCSPYDDAPNVSVSYCPMCGRKLGND